MKLDSTTTCTCKAKYLSGAFPEESVCAPLLYAGHEKTGILFVRHWDDLTCPHLRSYSYGEFCMSSERIEEYLQHGVEALRTGQSNFIPAVG